MGKSNSKRFQFSTKANTLLLLHDSLHYADVLDMVLFTVGDFICHKAMVLAKIQNTFTNQSIIIRSSAKAEDGKRGTLAGHFKSVLNVDSNNTEKIISAINEVISSYMDEKYDKKKLYHQQIFVQRQIQPDEIEISGVAFSYDPHSLAPYFCVNYDINGSTNAVTSGSGQKLIYLHRNFENHTYPWGNLVKVLKEIEGIFGCRKIDVEFAILKNSQIIVFQARRLFTQNKPLNVIKYDKLIHKAFGFIENCGDVFSDMSFWNPAEMIGREAHPLDYSLYEILITDRAWNKGLTRIGYTLDESKLMIHVGNHPYISIKKTANALIPQNINEQIRKKVVQHYLNCIKQTPSAHDKIEFEVIYNCAYKGIEDDLKKSFKGILTDDEISEYYLALYQLTQSVIKLYSSLKRQDLEALDDLRLSQTRFKSKINHSSDLHERATLIKGHIESVLSLIVPQFACHARCAFISKKILSSFVDSGDITANEVDEFLSSISTVVTDFLLDMGNKSLSDKELETKYGHLRNSTYNILSKKYADIGINKLRGQNLPTSFWKNTIDKNNFFKSIAEYFHCNIKDIDEFIVGSIQMRELLKFEYSRSVSLILDAVEALSPSVTAEELAYVNLDDLLKVKPTTSVEDFTAKLKLLSNRNKRIYDKNLALLCPSVITSFIDCFEVKVYEDRPNFVTNKKIIADVVVCTERMLNEDFEELDLSDKIVILEKAEPGNDWIFSKYKIAGLIAKYGGAASHMAIRCLEQGIPAALGCGEKIFRYVSDCKKILLDCKSEVISKIS